LPEKDIKGKVVCRYYDWSAYRGDIVDFTLKDKDEYGNPKTLTQVRPLMAAIP
jgi:hypothetical protein